MKMAEQNATNQNQQYGQCSAHALYNFFKKVTIADVDSAEPKKSLTNIYYDCLEHIFDYLDLQSLMNVAGTCKRLQIAAAAKFTDDHGEKCVALLPSKFLLKSGIFIESQEIDVFGLEFCHPFLWSFGAKISHLNFCEMNTSDFFVSLEQDINKYCADTLKSLEFQYRHYNQTFSLENNPKPFKQVEKIRMEVCDFHGKFERVNTMFPNLRHLALAAVNVDDDFKAGVSIPHLDHLDITLTSYFSFGLKEATDMIKANRQLQELRIDSFEFEEVKLAKLLDMISENTSISNLSVRLELTNVNTDELMRFAVEHPSIVDLDFWCYRMTANNVTVFIRNLNSLKKFQFKLIDDSQYDVLKSELDAEWKIEHVNDGDEEGQITYVLNRKPNSLSSVN